MPKDYIPYTVRTPLGYIKCSHKDDVWYLNILGSWVSDKDGATLMHEDFADKILSPYFAGPRLADGSWMKPTFVYHRK